MHPTHPARSTSSPARQRRGTGGFTIIEVALAASIMALGIATSIIVMQSGFKAIDVARDTTLASQILQSEMERIRLMPWSNTGTTAVDSITELPAKEAVDLSTMFSSSTEIANKFQVVRIVEADSSRPAAVKYITLSVTWRTSDGRSQTRSFRSMYSKNGLYDYFYTVAH